VSTFCALPEPSARSRAAQHQRRMWKARRGIADATSSQIEIPVDPKKLAATRGPPEKRAPRSSEGDKRRRKSARKAKKKAQRKGRKR